MLDIQNMLAAATQFEPMTQIPFLTSSLTGSGGTTAMFNALFTLSIVIGAMLAVFMFIWGGLQMITARDSAGSVGKGKEKMTNAVMGLLMLISTFVVLNTINPQLTSLTLFKDAQGNDIKGLEAAPRTQNTTFIQKRGQGSTVTPDKTGTDTSGQFCYSTNTNLGRGRYTGVQEYCYTTVSNCTEHANGVVSCFNKTNRQDAQRLGELGNQQVTLYCKSTTKNARGGRRRQVADCNQGYYGTKTKCGNDCISVTNKTATQLTKDGPYQIKNSPTQKYANNEVCTLEAKKTIPASSCITI